MKKHDRKKKISRMIIVCCMAAICLIPLPRYYKDGGTVEWRAVLYTYRQWHFLDGDIFDQYKNDPEYAEYYKDGYWIRNDFYLFPANLREHDFFE